MLQTADVLAATVLYSYVSDKTLELPVSYQQVFDTLPSRIQLMYDYRSYIDAPSIALMKVYGSNYHSEIPKYYLLYLNTRQREINVTVDLTPENHCCLVETIWPLFFKVQSSSKLH
jgi:hypothetical protein